MEHCSFKKFLAYVYFNLHLLMHLFDQGAEVQSEFGMMYETCVDVIHSKNIVLWPSCVG